MVAQRHSTFIPLETYYTLEEAAETKSEYFDGVIVAMSGGSLDHVEIIRDLSAEMTFQLRGTSCKWYPSELLVYSPSCNTVFYPDLTVICDTPQFSNRRLATLLNPTLIIEVLSDSTEAKDRGEKFACYQTLPSLVTYVLVSQHAPRIETFTRQDDDSWRYQKFEGMEAVVLLSVIGCRLSLTDVYAGVSFPPPSNGDIDTDTTEIPG